MSRQIDIGYRCDGRDIAIEIPPPFYLFGCQDSSIRFWSIPRLREIGITRLSELGVSDPVGFFGWEMLAELDREIALLHEHLATIDFNPNLKAEWLAHLTYCYHLLVLSAPKHSVPELTIG